MKYFLSLFLFFAIHFVRAQFATNYTPCPVQDTVPANVYDALQLTLKDEKALAANLRSKERSYMESLYDKQAKFVLAQFNGDYFITESEVTAYLQKILDKIYQANPQLPRETNVFAHRSAAPNAISFGDGTIGFTLGLLTYMPGEAEVAYVLCHELAHYHVGHSDKNIQELTALNFDKELKKKMNDIRASEYNRYTRYKNLLKGLQFSVLKHSRTHEFEADSIGLQYFMNTDYDLSGAVRTIHVLDSVDVPKYADLIDFKKFFNFKEFPFKEDWVEYTKSDMWYATMDESGEDTTKTHPSCERRIVALTRQLERKGKTVDPHYVPDKASAHIQAVSDFELVESAYHFKAYGRALFNAMVLVPHYPDNAYLHAMIGKCLYQLYVHQKNHEIGKVLSLPDPRFAENYDRFLTFIHTLRLHELASLSYYYLINGKEAYFSNEHYIYSLWLCSDLEMSKLDRDKIKEEYKEKFPDGKYLKYMERP